MINVNTTLLDLETLFRVKTQATLWLMSRSLNEIKLELEEAKEQLIMETFEFGQNVDEIRDIDYQLSFVSQNLSTVELALLAHETKCFEKRLALKDLGLVGLN